MYMKGNKIYPINSFTITDTANGYPKAVIKVGIDQMDALKTEGELFIYENDRLQFSGVIDQINPEDDYLSVSLVDSICILMRDYDLYKKNGSYRVEWENTSVNAICDDVVAGTVFNVQSAPYQFINLSGEFENCLSLLFKAANGAYYGFDENGNYSYDGIVTTVGMCGIKRKGRSLYVCARGASETRVEHKNVLTFMNVDITRRITEFVSTTEKVIKFKKIIVLGAGDGINQIFASYGDAYPVGIHADSTITSLSEAEAKARQIYYNQYKNKELVVKTDPFLFINGEIEVGSYVTITEPYEYAHVGQATKLECTNEDLTIYIDSQLQSVDETLEDIADTQAKSTCYSCGSTVTGTFNSSTQTFDFENPIETEFFIPNDDVCASVINDCYLNIYSTAYRQLVNTEDKSIVSALTAAMPVTAGVWTDLFTYTPTEDTTEVVFTAGIFPQTTLTTVASTIPIAAKLYWNTGDMKGVVPMESTKWTYRKRLDIVGSDTEQTNYQMKLIVHRTDGTDGGGHIYVGERCKDDFSDLRFTAEDGTGLSYWVEEINPSIDVEYAYSAATASSGTASYLIDDNDTTTWDGSSASVDGNWFKIDYGAGNAKVINSYRFVFWNYGGYYYYQPVEWVVYGSNDDASWTEIQSLQQITTEELTSSQLIRTFDNTTAYRYYKFSITNAARNSVDGKYQVDLTEVNLFNNETIENAAIVWVEVDKIDSGGDVYYIPNNVDALIVTSATYVPANLIDSNYTTYYQSIYASDKTNQIVYDFGSAIILNGIVLQATDTNPPMPLKRWIIYGSNSSDALLEHDSWVLLDNTYESTNADWTVGGATGYERCQAKKMRFENTTAYRYYIFYMPLGSSTLYSGNYYWQMSELKFFYSPSTDYIPNDSVLEKEQYPYTTVTADSYWDANYTPTMAFNRVRTDGWHSGNGVALPHWLKVNYGAGVTKVVNKFMLKPRNDGTAASGCYWPVAFEFQGSNDDTNWTTLFSKTNETYPAIGESKWYEFENEIGYRYYRIYITSSQRLDGVSTTYSSFSEIQFFYKPTDITITSNSVYMGQHSCSFAFDKRYQGNVNSTAGQAWATMWASESSKAFPHWIKIDYGEEKLVNTYSIIPRYDIVTQTPTRWKLEGSNDDTNWTVIDDRYYAAVQTCVAWTAGVKRTFNTTNTTAYRYYRLYCPVTAPSADNIVSIEELELLYTPPLTYIYMYYGNNDALSASNGDNTFPFWDGFDYGVHDPNKWNTPSGGTVAYADSCAKWTTAANADYSMTSKITVGDGYVACAKFKTIGNCLDTRAGPSIRNNGTTRGYSVESKISAADDRALVAHGNVWGNAWGDRPTYDVWKKAEVVYLNGTVFGRFDDEYPLASNVYNRPWYSWASTSETGTYNGLHRMSGSATTRVAWYDWYYTRKFTLPEPVIWQTNTEEEGEYEVQSMPLMNQITSANYATGVYSYTPLSLTLTAKGNFKNVPIHFQVCSDYTINVKCSYYATVYSLSVYEYPYFPMNVRVYHRSSEEVPWTLVYGPEGDGTKEVNIEKINISSYVSKGTNHIKITTDQVGMASIDGYYRLYVKSNK